MMQNVLIFGAGGFCARHLLKRLRAENISSISGADVQPYPPRDLKLDAYYNANITDEAQVNEIVRSVKPDTVFHLAGLNCGSPADVYRVNLLGSIHLLEALRKFAPQAHVLMVGSAAEYGYVPEEDMPINETFPCHPESPYGISKYAMTLTALEYVRHWGMKIVVARPFNIVGAGVPSSLVVGAILERTRKAIEKLENPVILRVGSLDTQRDFIAVQDVVESYVRLIQGDYWGEVFNICSGKPRSIRTVIEMILKNADQSVHLQIDPDLVRSKDVRCVFGNPQKSQHTFGFVTKVTLEEALKEAWSEVMGGICLE
jgi:GDP-4-dehydro-6-deoxy-D-mannose reductase